MPQSTLGEVLRVIQRIYAVQGACDLTDRELVQRYLANKDEVAFAALVKRHGPMVFGVARRLLRDNHQAEDVFQATFLVLVRRMGSIKRKQSIGSWLYGTAQRIALPVRSQTGVRRRREGEAGLMRSQRTADELSLQELRSVLDEEIGVLPEKYRAPVVLCYLEGNSYEQAARELGCAKSTLDSRLARARQLLRNKLERRGLSLAAAALTATLAEMTAAAPLPAMLAVKTIKAAALVAAGKSALGCFSSTAVALAEDAMAGMLALRAKLISMVLALGIAAGGAGLAGSGMVKRNPGTVAQPLVAKEVADGPMKREPSTDQQGDTLREGAVARLGTVRFRHEGDAWALYFSPNGRELFGYTKSGVVTWDAATGKELHRFSKGPGRGISPEGRVLAVREKGEGNLDTEIGLWNVRSGTKIRTLALPTRGFDNRLAFSPDGMSIAHNCHNEGKLVIFDVLSGQTRAVLGGRDILNFYRFAFSPDGKTAAAVVKHKGTSDELTLQVWEMAAARLIHAIPAGILTDQNRINIAFAPNGRMLALANVDQILLVDPLKDVNIRRLNIKLGRDPVLTFSPDSKKLVSTESCNAVIWEVATGEILRKFEGRSVGFASAAYTPDGKTLALGTAGTTVRLWDVGTGKELFADDEGSNARVDTIAFSPDGTRIVSSADGENCIAIWDTASRRQIARLAGNARSFSFSPDGERLATLAFDGARNKVRIWDMASGNEMVPITVPDATSVTSAMLSRDGRLLFTVDVTEHKVSIRHLDATTGKQEHIWVFPVSGWAWPLYLAMDGRTVFAGTFAGINESTISIYKAGWGRVRVLGGQEKSLLSSFPFSPDARLVVSMRDMFAVMEVLSGKEVFKTELPKGSYAQFAWSSDGRVMASGE